MKDDEITISLLAHLLARDRKKNSGKVSKYNLSKKLLGKLNESSKDEDIVNVYGEAYVSFCKDCKFLENPDPLCCDYVERCEVYKVKRKCFSLIENRELIYKFLDKIKDNK